MSKTRLGGTLDDFVFAAHVVSLSEFSRRVLYRFSMQNKLDEAVKFDPRFFLMLTQGSNSHALPVKPRRAWITLFGLFLYLPATPNGRLRWVLVPASDPVSLLLRVCLNRLAMDENPDKPSLLDYFWRMNVLR